MVICVLQQSQMLICAELDISFKLAKVDILVRSNLITGLVDVTDVHEVVKSSYVLLKSVLLQSYFLIYHF